MRKITHFIYSLFLIIFVATSSLAATGTVASFSPGASAFGAAGGNGTIAVTSTTSWTAATTVDWISITSGSSFSGNGNISYVVSGNSTGSARTGTIELGDQTFSVRQGKSDFSDNLDPSSWSQQYINGIYAAGITVGCGDNNFCADSNVTREQMAAFIVRAKFTENFQTASQTPHFNDVPQSSVFFKYIQKMWEVGLAAPNPSFNPSGPVTREQMAAFITRSLYGENFAYSKTPYFTDVPSTSVFFKYVQKLKDVGLTVNTGSYRASDPVRRDEMAAFLARAFLGMTATYIPSDGRGSTIQVTSAVVPETTKILSSSATSTLSSVTTDGAVIQIVGNDPEISSINPGDTVVIGVTPKTPNGLLRKVVSVNKGVNGTVLTTEQGKVADAIQSGSWNVKKVLDINDTVTPQDMAKGVAIPQVSAGTFVVTMNNIVLLDKDGNPTTTNDQIVANGSVTIRPSFEFSGEIESFHLKKLSFVDTTSVTSNVHVSANATVTGFDKKFEIGKYYLPVVVIPVGTFPIEVTPVITVDVGVSGDVSVGISTGFEQTSQLSAGLSYDSGNWSIINGHDETYLFNPPTISAAASAKCYAGPNLGLLIYGVTGPYVGVDGYLALEANPADNPWWQLYGGIEATAGVKLDVFGLITASYSANLFDYREILSQASGGYVPPATTTYSMSGVLHSGSNSGPPLPGATVSIAGKTATTASDGSFSILNVPSGTHDLSISRMGYDTYTASGYYIGSNQIGLSFYLTGVTASPLDTWHVRSDGLPSDIALWSVAFGNNKFVAVGPSSIAVSSGGQSWESQTVPAYLEGVAYGNNTFLAAGASGVVSTSSDGMTWTVQGEPSALSPSFTSVGYENGMFLLGTIFGQLYLSPDGRTGTSVNSGTTHALTAFGYGKGVFTAVGDMGTIVTSPDGTAWTPRSSGVTKILNGVAYGNDTFVAVGGIFSGKIVISNDGITWTPIDLPVTPSLKAVAYGGGVFLAVGENGLILTSPDGVTWTQRDAGVWTDLLGVTFGNGTFVIVGRSTILQSDPV